MLTADVCSKCKAGCCILPRADSVQTMLAVVLTHMCAEFVGSTCLLRFVASRYGDQSAICWGVFHVFSRVACLPHVPWLASHTDHNQRAASVVSTTSLLAEHTAFHVTLCLPCAGSAAKVGPLRRSCVGAFGSFCSCAGFPARRCVGCGSANVRLAHVKRRPVGMVEDLSI